MLSVSCIDNKIIIHMPLKCVYYVYKYGTRDMSGLHFQISVMNEQRNLSKFGFH